MDSQWRVSDVGAGGGWTKSIYCLTWSSSARILADVPEESEAGLARREAFVTTHWSAVLRAGQSNTPDADGALEELCRAYWLPLYAFVRRKGHSPEAAQDLTQGFFAKLLQKNYLRTVDPSKGKFRTFLLTALKGYVANDWDRSHAAKRGGFQSIVELDQATAESIIAPQLADAASPDILFERQWAVALLEFVMKRLEQEYVETGRTKLFQHLARTLTREEDAQSYAVIATELQLTEAAVKTAARRLRLRYQEVLREEIGRTVATRAEIEEELHYLFGLFGN